jgi:hypothetical protein
VAGSVQIGGQLPDESDRDLLFPDGLLEEDQSRDRLPVDVLGTEDGEHLGTTRLAKLDQKEGQIVD